MPVKSDAYQRASNRGRMSSYKLTEDFRQYWTSRASWEGAPAAGGDYRGHRTATIYIGQGQSSGTAGLISVYGDTITEPGDYFWWEIVSVSDGVAAMPSGDAAWGKTTIVDDDRPPPPRPCLPDETTQCPTTEDLPWRITTENVGLSRPADSIVVGLPLAFYLKNVKDSCLPEAAPKPYQGHCGTDIWPLNPRTSPSEWESTNVSWSAGADGLLEGWTFKADRIVVEDGDPYQPALWECTNLQPTIITHSDKRGKSAPGKRWVYGRTADAHDEPGVGECSFEYQEWGSYNLKVSVFWQVYACRGPDADSDGKPEPGTLVCSTPYTLEDWVVIPVTVGRIIQENIL